MLQEIHKNKFSYEYFPLLNQIKSVGKLGALK